MKKFFTILILSAVFTQSFWSQINQNESAKREVFQIEQNLTLKENQSIFIEPQSQTKKNDIDDETLKQITKCPINFQCLNDESYELCPVIRQVHENVIFINTTKPESCNHIVPFGDYYMCSCPTRCEVYRRYGK